VIRFEYKSDTVVEAFIGAPGSVVSVGTVSANVPAGDPLQPVLSVRSRLGGGAGAKAMSIDVVDILQDRI